MLIITIDGGTTNTRVRILEKEKIVGKASLPIGVRCTAITSRKEALLKGLRRIIDMALKEARVRQEDIHLAIASGMITSNVGVYELAHVASPAGVNELAAASRLVKVPEVLDVPIVFIPGIKNNCVIREDLSNLEAMDIMRGEETETVGILELKSLDGPLTLILPGSHTKVVRVNEHNQITGCLTTMAGEIFTTLAANTILADSIPDTLVSYLDVDIFLKGVAVSRDVGLTRGCFATRILSQFASIDGNRRASFLLGVVLGQDLTAIKNSSACGCNWCDPVVIGGPQPLRQAMYWLLKTDPDITGEIVLLDDETVEMSTVIGARKIGLKYLEMVGGLR